MMMNATPIFRFALTRPIKAGLAAGMILLMADRAFSAPLLDNPQAFEKNAQICSIPIQSQERAKGIPKGLLQAISLAESGRWIKNPATNKGENIAWPWTVTTGGKGHFLPNRLDAIAFVKSLQADGVQNIDVGCMQINLKYHPDAFISVEQAFDPRINTAYAASFLKERKNHTHSWIEAAGDYHSTTPDLNALYTQKITALWHKTAKSDFMTASADTTITQPDVAATQRFNRAFKIRRNNTAFSRPGQEIANRVNALKPGANLTRGGENHEQSFAQRRQAQLAAWRRKNGGLTVN
ncbi:MAG: transglycosylase SLT domain-containing protein [Magnetovibrio sp.]|nr:transglycosylase SLT domain-containing protein [Magnetovibrio sp.]